MDKRRIKEDAETHTLEKDTDGDEYRNRPNRLVWGI